MFESGATGPAMDTSQLVRPTVQYDVSLRDDASLSRDTPSGSLHRVGLLFCVAAIAACVIASTLWTSPPRTSMLFSPGILRLQNSYALPYSSVWSKSSATLDNFRRTSMVLRPSNRFRSASSRDGASFVPTTTIESAAASPTPPVGLLVAAVGVGLSASMLLYVRRTRYTASEPSNAMVSVIGLPLDASEWSSDSNTTGRVGKFREPNDRLAQVRLVCTIAARPLRWLSLRDPYHTAVMQSRAASMSATHAGTAGSEENEDAENEAAKLSDKADVEPQQKKTKQSSLYRRVTTALCLGAIWVTAALTGSYPLTLVLGLTQLIAVREYFGMVSLKGQAGATTICSACCLIFPLVAQYAPYRMSLMLPMAATTICVYLVLRSSLLKQTLFTFSTAIFGLFYLAYLPSFWVRLRGIDFASGLPFQALWPSVLGGPQHLTMGLAMFVGTVLCIIMADVGGYVVGKNFGRIQLTKVSPNKTVEGALGGAAGCVSMALLLAWSMHWPFWYLTGTAFGLIVFLASLFGDLTQSVMKRDAGVKDSGNILPGHGGILDRFDSYIFTAPLAYYFMQFLIIPLMGLGPWYK